MKEIKNIHYNLYGEPVILENILKYDYNNYGTEEQIKDLKLNDYHPILKYNSIMHIVQDDFRITIVWQERLKRKEGDY